MLTILLSQARPPDAPRTLLVQSLHRGSLVVLRCAQHSLLLLGFMCISTAVVGSGCRGSAAESQAFDLPSSLGNSGVRLRLLKEEVACTFTDRQLVVLQFAKPGSERVTSFRLSERSSASVKPPPSPKPLRRYYNDNGPGYVSSIKWSQSQEGCLIEIKRRYQDPKSGQAMGMDYQIFWEPGGFVEGPGIITYRLAD